MILALLTSPIILSTLAADLLAQGYKAVKAYRKERRFKFSLLFKDAGMPSSHTATVTALTLSVFLTEGATTVSFVTLVLSLIVINDVLGDKAFAEKQEHALNKFLDALKQHFEYGEKISWKEFIGHTISEVLAGLALGILCTLIVFSLFDLL